MTPETRPHLKTALEELRATLSCLERGDLRQATSTVNAARDAISAAWKQLDEAQPTMRLEAAPPNPQLVVLQRLLEPLMARLDAAEASASRFHQEAQAARALENAKYDARFRVNIATEILANGGFSETLLAHFEPTEFNRLMVRGALKLADLLLTEAAKDQP